MLQRIGMSLGAGVVSALLFAVMAKGTPLATALACLASLPIVIATLGWGLDMGGIAAVTACLGAVGIADLPSGGVFGASFVAPAWILSALTLMPRARLFGAVKDSAEEPSPWFPVGGVVSVAALIGALVGLGVIGYLVLGYGGYQKGVETLAAEMASDVHQAFDEVIALPAGMTIEEFATLTVRMAPTILATVVFLILCANLYIGARVAQFSQILKRPWPNLPESLVLPPALGVALIVCIGVAFAFDDLARQVALIGVGPLSAAFALQGLALIHALTRGLPARNPALFAFYLTCALLSRWGVPLPLLAIAGVVESFLSLRAKRVAAANAKP